MSTSAMFTALVGGILVWLLIARRLTAKSWQPHATTGDIGAIHASAGRVGLWVFLGVVTSLFGLFLSAYSMRMHHGGDSATIPLPRILWVNTELLIIASLALELGRRALSQGKLSALKVSMVAAGLFTGAFLAGQAVAWRQMSAAVQFLCTTNGQFIQSSPSAAFFYLITGVHGMHLLGGLWVWGRTTTRLAGGAELIDVRQSVDLLATYWHFLLLVWIVLFAVLSN